ncbi:prepilin-type N-terminal cleavage/methylation domain-containing protein [Photobacterium sp. J15]|uniref:prepilin-type N-terminal cleavage/methylation domain-containing protein n=1 Tax=Photobacterium sp. J15 TaxID=265901 RepID=UPI0007E3FD76|nr:prepilin-type N-terminal cleavage/methylation domain-containing protein [Photobacterium sp. J15]
MKYISKDNGFTIIELIVVIVIAGIVAVIAAPRIMNTSTDAKIASLNGFISAFRAAESIVEGKMIIEGKEMTSQHVLTSQEGIEAQYGSIRLSNDNLKRMMNVNGYRIVTCLDKTQMFVVPATYKDVPDGEDSIEACRAALATFCWVSLYNPQKEGTENERVFDISRNYTKC